ncbi:MAG: DNA ligase D [Tatlockia sp.]|nr:DNA ligase D [Tatlockia sp.]
MGLKRYQQKRDFDKTPEPKGRVSRRNQHRFYVQKHAASRLHYDFRLELGGVLKSWAVPKGPSLNPETKRLAVHVEDHPLEYGTFEGIIPKGEYGGGTVMLWDQGTWQPLDKDPQKEYEKGHLRFLLDAEKLKGRWDLIRFKKEENSWFLVKYKDEYAREDGYDIEEELPNSVATHQSIDEIAENYQAEWTRKGLKKKRRKALNLPKSPMPDWVAPQLATLVDKPPLLDSWIHEVKFDGYRILAFKKGKNIQLMSRNHKDWTSKFQSIADVLSTLPIKNAIFDGEIVLLNEDKRSDFQLLQNSFKSGKDAPYYYYIFDLLYYENWDIRKIPLIERKELLQELLNGKSDILLFSDHIEGDAQAIFINSCELGLEGVISKRSEAFYQSGRTTSWLKIKCHKRQEMVIGGFTPPKHSRSHFGSLLLGYYDQNSKLIYSGKVGTGFNEESLTEIYKALEKKISAKTPFSTQIPGYKTAIWVKPELVAEVEFSEWTEDGRLRHPSFKGLRFDKKAKSIVKETEQTMSKSTVKLSHPDKILYPGEGITKEDILHYYEQVSSFILPHIANRPLTLVRCPENYKKCFFQKKLKESHSSSLHPIEIEISNGPEEYLYIDNEEGLFTLVQLGVLEFHPWGSRIDSLDYPDRLIFDLDPAPDVSWKEIVSAAFDIKENLEQYNLKSFVKTTGGKGIHVVVPIKPEYDWDTIKEFTHVFVNYMEQLNPEKYVSTIAKAKRKGKIFIDYLRNQYNATAVAAFSTRARLHATVATPLSWDEFTDNQDDTFYTIKTLPKRLKHLKKDPWKDFFLLDQSLNLDKLIG